MHNKFDHELGGFWGGRGGKGNIFSVCVLKGLHQTTTNYGNPLYKTAPNLGWGIMVVFRVDNQGSQIFKYSVLIYIKIYIYNHNYESNTNKLWIYDHDFYFIFFEKEKRTTNPETHCFFHETQYDSLIYF